MNDTLKAAGRIGAELGAAKAENERLRGLLAEVAHCLRTTDEQPLYWEENLASRIYRTLSQQAEPCGTCEPEGVMATDGSGPFDCPDCGKKAAARNGSETTETRATAGLEGAAQPAQAQDEREAFEAEARKLLYVLDREAISGEYIVPDTENAWQLWQARATRPAQTEQQPEDQVSATMKLPCELKLPGGMTIGKGCQLSTLLLAMRDRENGPIWRQRFGQPQPFDPALHNLMAEFLAAPAAQAVKGGE
jgi:predicted RNA-binding Zn-ribbon protein involved in translation (DUF1610 family)